MKEKMREELKKTKKIIVKKVPKVGGPRNRSPWIQAVIALFIFVILASGYSLITSIGESVDEVSLSALATDITEAKVRGIVVTGDELNVSYIDGSKKLAKKEANTALTTTLTNYGVPTTALSSVEIEVKNDQGALFWIGSLAPIILPILFILFSSGFSRGK